MRHSQWKIYAPVLGALLLAAPVSATVKAGPAAHNPKATASKARAAWPPETLDGTVMTVDAARRLLIVNGPGNVPFDLRVNGRTRIFSGKQPLKLASLAATPKQHVSVRFVPERSGDVARLIRIEK